MSSLALVVYYLTKEAVKPRMHHSNSKEYLDDVDVDCFRHTHSYNHTKYISKLYKIFNQTKDEDLMKKKMRLERAKLIQASNAVSMGYQEVNKDLKRFSFVKKVKNAREKFQLPKRMN